jgi:hypothetical protein
MLHTPGHYSQINRANHHYWGRDAQSVTSEPGAR